MANETTEKVRGWTKAGTVFTFIVKGHGAVKFDTSKASKALMDSFLDYGIGRIFPDRTSQLQGLAKLEGMRKLISLAESGADSISLRETAEEKLAREQAAAKADLVEALDRLGYGDKAEAAIAAYGKERSWAEAMTVVALSGQAEVALKILEIQQERKLERAGPAPKIDLAGLMAKLGG
jgi:hypothetical protein